MKYFILYSQFSACSIVTANIAYMPSTGFHIAEGSLRRGQRALGSLTFSSDGRLIESSTF